MALPASSSGVLITVSQVSDGNEDAVPVARSYDGRDYETLKPLLLPVDCTASPCTVVLPPYSGVAAMHYIIQQYTPPAKTAAESFSRLLLQGTYGPTQASLTEAMGLGSALSWVQDQISKPVSLLREHYRKRTNSYTKNELRHHATRVPCEAGSRWARYAFSRWRDVGKTVIEEASGTGSYYLKVDGIVRTEVATRPSDDFSLGVNEYVICRHITTEPNNPYDTYVQMSSFVQAPSGSNGQLVVATSAADCENNMVTVSKCMGAPNYLFL